MGVDPFHVLVAEALELPAAPAILRNEALLRTLVLANGINTRLVSKDAWEAAAMPRSASGVLTASGYTRATAIWNLVLKLRAAGKLQKTTAGPLRRDA